MGEKMRGKWWEMLGNGGKSMANSGTMVGNNWKMMGHYGKSMENGA